LLVAGGKPEGPSSSERAGEGTIHHHHQHKHELPHPQEPLQQNRRWGKTGIVKLIYFSSLFSWWPSKAV